MKYFFFQKCSTKHRFIYVFTNLKYSPRKNKTMKYFLQCSPSLCLSLTICCHQPLCGHLGTTSALWEASLFIYIILQQIS